VLPKTSFLTFAFIQKKANENIEIQL